MSWARRQHAELYWHLAHLEDVAAQYDADLDAAFQIGEGIKVVGGRNDGWHGDEVPVVLPDLKVPKPRRKKPPRIFVRVRRRKKP